jgi:hypothetical protein
MVSINRPAPAFAGVTVANYEQLGNLGLSAEQEAEVLSFLEILTDRFISPAFRLRVSGSRLRLGECTPARRNERRVDAQLEAMTIR